MLYRLTGDEILRDDASYWHSRTDGTRCAWIAARHQPCNNSSKLTKKDGLYYCPVHLGISMLPGQEALQAKNVDAYRRRVNARAWAARIAVASERKPRPEEEPIVTAMLARFSGMTFDAIRVVERPILLVGYAYGHKNRNVPGGIEVGDVCGFPKHPLTAYAYCTNDVVWEYQQRLPGTNPTNYKIGLRTKSSTHHGLFFTSIASPFYGDRR